MASVTFHLNSQILRGGKPRLFEGSPGFRRNFMYVWDVCAVFGGGGPECRGFTTAPRDHQGSNQVGNPIQRQPESESKIVNYFPCF